MADVEPTLAELIRRALESRVAQVRVSMPGTVISYDPTAKTAVVQPCLSDVLFDDDDNRVVQDLQPIQNVPVVFPGSSRLTLHFGLEADDTGDLVFATNSINDWQASGNVAAPGDLRPHPLGSAKFYPGLRHNGNTPPEIDESLGIPGGLRLSFTAAAIQAGAGSDFVALASLVDARLSALESYVSALILPVSGATAGPPAAPISGGSTACANLKADP